MANEFTTVSFEENLAELQDDKFGLFGYVNFSRFVLGSGVTATEFHWIFGTTDTPQGVTIYDSAPSGSLFSRNNAGVGELFVKEATGATGWAIFTTGAPG